MTDEQTSHLAPPTAQSSGYAAPDAAPRPFPPLAATQPVQPHEFALPAHLPQYTPPAEAAPFAFGAAPVSFWQQPGRKAMVIGFGIAAVGLAITAGTYLFAEPGGTFTVMWGAAIFGAVQGIRGVVQAVKG